MSKAKTGTTPTKHNVLNLESIAGQLRTIHGGPTVQNKKLHPIPNKTSPPCTSLIATT